MKFRVFQKNFRVFLVVKGRLCMFGNKLLLLSMNDHQKKRVSKLMSLILRHDPGRFGLSLDDNGYVGVNDLLEALEGAGHIIKVSELREIVETNGKKRFSFSPSGWLIRANQGHSVDVQMDFQIKEPPAVLYHGTAEKFVDSIMYQGLLKGNRHHVHLSVDQKTAEAVGRRHGRPVVFRVDAAHMHFDGFDFMISENGVWLVDYVPFEYLSEVFSK